MRVRVSNAMPEMCVKTIEYLATYYVNFTKADLKSLVCVWSESWFSLNPGQRDAPDIETGAAYEQLRLCEPSQR